MTIRKTAAGFAGLTAFVLLTAADASVAAPSRVYSPRVEKGELEFEHRGIVTDDEDPSKDGELKMKNGLGYGVTDWWFVEAYAEHEREPGGSLKFEAIEVESLFQLTQPGQYWADFGFVVEYAMPMKGGHDEIEFGPLIEKQIGPTVHTANLIISKETGRGVDSYKLEYAWASRWRLSPHFEPGVEAYGEPGEFRNFSPQRDAEHKIGPAIRGNIPLGVGPGKLHYEAAYLLGLTKGTPEGTFRWHLEYEVRF